MTKKTKLKLRDFAKAHKLTPEQHDRLAATMENASAAQAEVILREASRALRTTKVVVRQEEPRLVQPATAAPLVQAAARFPGFAR